VTRIGDGFLYGSSVAEVLLPPTLRSLGWRALANTSNLQSLDLSHTQLLSIGEEFLCGSRVKLKDVALPPTFAERKSYSK
jgi:hypothetical protein